MIAPTRVGFVGLGSQGGPMALRILEGGFQLTVWGRRPATVEPFEHRGATVVSTPAELGAASDVVGICVVSDADVEEVVLRDDGVLSGMSPGGVIAIHSTVHPDTCREIAALASERGVEVVDAPVSGGGPAAAVGRLLVMVGGGTEALERCRPVFDTFADPVVHLGPLGSGQTAKLLNNLIFAAQVSLAVETVAFAERLGLDERALAEVLAHGSGATRALAILAGSGFDLTGLRQAEPLLRKDVGLMRQVAAAHGAAEPARLVELARATLATLAAPTEDPGSSSDH